MKHVCYILKPYDLHNRLIEAILSTFSAYSSSLPSVGYMPAVARSKELTTTAYGKKSPTSAVSSVPVYNVKSSTDAYWIVPLAIK